MAQIGTGLTILKISLRNFPRAPNVKNFSKYLLKLNKKVR